MKRIAILGCTGSIGDAVSKVVSGMPDQLEVVSVSGGRRLEKLIQRARQFGASQVCVSEAAHRQQVMSAVPGAEILTGDEGLKLLVENDEVDVVVNGLVGSVGLGPTLAALQAGKVVAMANKEPLVMAGDLIQSSARSGGGVILPLDSEPNALWQCLKGESVNDVSRLFLTASGGPFYGWTLEQMRAITPAQALSHPTWRMGKKITVDSATLMNKGFEVIEACYFFRVEIDRVEVVIHRQSIVHSMVEFTDGAILAHMGKTDMALPIQYALSHPNREKGLLEPLDLIKAGTLTFDAPDRKNFPCLDLCYSVSRAGGGTPAALNAADELAVQAFLDGRIGFLDIFDLNEAVVERCGTTMPDSLDAVNHIDRVARVHASEFLERHGSGRGRRRP